MGAMKRSLCVFLVLMSLTACMQAIGNVTGTDFSRVANPVMELEMNLVFLDGISALTKMNQIILERVSRLSRRSLARVAESLF